MQENSDTQGIESEKWDKTACVGATKTPDDWSCESWGEWWDPSSKRQKEMRYVKAFQLIAWTGDFSLSELGNYYRVLSRVITFDEKTLSV